MPSAERKARVTSWPTGTSRKGPKGLGAGKPKRPVKSSAAARGSFEWTMVWFSLMAMARSDSNEGGRKGPAPLGRGAGREEREKLPSRLRSVGREVRLGILEIGVA